MQKMITRKKLPVVRQFLKSSPEGTTELGAVVVTVSIVVPLPVTVGMLKTHALSDGSPLQEKLVTPLKPFEPAMVIVVEADWPGLVTLMSDGEADTTKSGTGAGVTVKLAVLLPFPP